MRKSPAEQINAAVTSQLPAIVMFPTEAAATDWARAHVTAVLRHKLDLLPLTPNERDALDPIEAGYVHAKDMGTRPRRQRITWIDKLLDEVADACFCEVVPLSGTMSSWLIGRRSDRATALQLLASLVPTAERLGQDAYLQHYHTNRRAGTVQAARGSKERWHLAMVDTLHESFMRQADLLRTEHPELGDALAAGKADIVGYMNENFLQTRGNRNVRVVRSR